MSRGRSVGGRSYREAREEIGAGRLRPVYLLQGTDARLREDLLQELGRSCLQPGMEAFNYLLLDGDAAEPHEVAGHLQTAPVLGGRRLVVVRDLHWFDAPRAMAADPPGDAEAAWLTVVRQAAGSPAVLVFTLGRAADGRRRLYREIASQGGVVNCSALPEADIVRWLRRKAKENGKDLPPEAAEALLAVAGTDLNRLCHELEKAVAYAGDEGSLTLEHLRAVVTGNTSWGVFDLTDAVAERQLSRALAIARDLVTGGEPPALLISLLGRQIRMLLAARALRDRGAGQERVASELGVPPWVARKYLQQAAGFRQDELEEAIEALVEADLALKSGRRDGGLAVELLVAGLTAKGRL
ncbi:MAG: DNA polymerase III subunit delta [bacterium]|nr:DNA polymerase III subunit delta [bacterium]